MDIKQLANFTKSLKLLFVEDDENVREDTLTFFSELFDDITVAVDGLDGLQKYEAGSFDIIISDIKMPNMDGLEMVKHIRALDKKVSIVMLTAYNDMKFLMDATDLRVTGYVVKPLTFESLGNELLKVKAKLEAKI